MSNRNVLRRLFKLGRGEDWEEKRYKILRESFTRGEKSLAHPRAVCALTLMRLVFTDLQILVYVRPGCRAIKGDDFPNALFETNLRPQGLM